MLGEKKRCPVIRQLHLATALVEEETESPGQSIFLLIPRLFVGPLVCLLSSTAPATLYPHNRSHRQATERKELGTGVKFRDLPNGDAVKILDASSETTVSPLAGVPKNADVVVSPRHAALHHRSKILSREPPAAFHRVDMGKEKACLPQPVLLNENPIYHSSKQTNQSQSNHFSDFMRSLNTSSESTRPLGRAARISHADDPVFDSDRELHNHPSNGQSNQPHDLMKSLGTSSEMNRSVDGQAVLEDKLEDYPVPVLSFAPRQPRNTCRPRIRHIEGQDRSLDLSSSPERRNPSSKSPSNGSQSDRCHDFTKSSSTSSRKFQPRIRFHVAQDNIEGESFSVSPHESCILSSKLQSNESHTSTKSSHKSSESTRSFIRTYTISNTQSRRCYARDNSEGGSFSGSSHEGGSFLGSPHEDDSFLGSPHESRILSSKSQFNESHTLTKSSDKSSESIRSFIRTHVVSDTPFRRHYTRDNIEDDSFLDSPHEGDPFVGSPHEGDSFLGSPHVSRILSSKSHFNESHIPTKSPDKSSESAPSIIRPYITNDTLFRLYDTRDNTEGHPSPKSRTHGFNSFDVENQSSIQFFKGRRSKGGMADVHREDTFGDDREIYTFRRITYRDMEAASKKQRSRRGHKPVLIDNVIEYSPEEMKYARAREAAQRGSIVAFKPEQPTMRSLGHMAPTLAVSMQDTSETVLERLRRVDLDRERVVPDMELAARTTIAGHLSRSVNNKQEDLSQSRVKQKSILRPSHNVDTRVERDEKKEGQGDENGQVADGSGRYDSPQQIEAATPPQSQLPNMQRLAVDGSHDIMNHAVRLAVRNGSFRPADQQHFLRVVEKLIGQKKEEEE